MLVDLSEVERAELTALLSGGRCQVGGPGRSVREVLSGWRALGQRGTLPGVMSSPNPYRGFRFPAEIIEHAVWLYHCFSLSLRDVELILAARGIVVSYESIRDWGLRFGRMFANTLRRRRPRPGDKWFLDEVFIRIRGEQHYFWRAVDQDGTVLDILVQSLAPYSPSSHLRPSLAIVCGTSYRSQYAK